VIFISVVTVHLPAQVSASDLKAEPTIVSFEQRDLDRDGRPDQAVIMADYTGGRYRVVVYDQGMDMQWSDDWRTGTDFVNDVWLFQTEAGEQTKLIIRFSHGAAGYTAELFDDVNGDGTVSYRMRDTRQIDITESSFPTVRMVAEQPWTLPDGGTNYLVHVTTYRPLFSPPILWGALSHIDYLPRDGRPAIEQEIIDSDADGIPDYELIRVFPDAPSNRMVFRTSLNINIGRKPLPGFRDSFFWPYLRYMGPGQWTPSYPVRRPDDFSPPIQLDWQEARIKAIANFLPSWGLGDK